MSGQNADSYATTLLNKKNKREAACLLKWTCSSLHETKTKLKLADDALDVAGGTEYGEKLKCVEDLMLTLLNPEESVDNYQNIEWCKWLIAGGDFPEEFAKQLREFDDAILCGLVWTPSFVAYRCRTCSLTPSMSLCADCFLSGDHEGHDFNMFRSQAGGACDCGDVQVMKESGFCVRHGPNARKNKPKPPSDLTCVAEFIFPHIFRRILLHLREKLFQNNDIDQHFNSVEKLIDFLQTLSDYGAVMKQTICSILLDKQIYRDLFSCDPSTNSRTMVKILSESQRCYKYSLKSLESICSKDDADVLDCPDLCPDLNHETFLDEFVFWLVRLEFPQKLVTFVLSLLPCDNYKQLLLDSFAVHYTRIAEILARPEATNELISHRVIHISVQLLSSDVLATNLVKNHKFLRVIVASLYKMIKRCLIECNLHTRKDNFHMVADCRNRIMDGHNYWVLASDLHNLINHAEITLQFLRDPVLLDLWCDMISVLQGMNVNVRELVSHVQFESRSYYPAFTAEIEICASTTWHLLQHLKDNSSYDCILVMLQNATCQIQEWFEAVQFQPHSCWKPPVLECCFHLPLHRLYAAFLCQGIKLGMQIPFPSETFLRQLVMHPLTIQVSRSEINCNMWVRNGTSMRYQACLYVQSHFSCSFSDLDVYLLQVCATKINPDWFVLTVFERFHLVDWLSFSPIQPVKPFLRPEWEMPMLEGAMRLIATMITNTINLGASEEECTTLEIATLLCQGDRTHSQILDLLPDKGSHSWPRNFEQILHELADYKAPQFEPGGAMSEGIYVPKNVVWEKYFDPLFVMLRSFQMKEFQTSMDRYSEYLKKNNLWHGEKDFWPPYIIPSRNFASYDGLKRLLHCRSLHSVIFDVLFKAVSEAYPVSEDALCLAVYLLELALRFPAQGAAISETSFANRHTVIDLQFCGWFPGNCIFTNLCHKIDRVLYIDNIPGLSRSCQDETNQGDFPDLIRLRAKLAGSTLTPTVENALVPSDLPRSRSADIPYIDSMEVESDGDPDYFYNKAMAFLPPRLRRQYFLTSTDRPALTMDDGGEASTSSSDAMALLVVGSREMTVHEDNSAMDFTNDDGEQPALQHDQRLAIEGGESEEASIVLRQPGTMALGGQEFVISADGTEISSLATVEQQKQLPESQQPPHALPQPKVYVTNVGESMLSLLIKLHNKFNTSSMYKPPANDQPMDDCRVGDGAFFIKKTLDRAYFDSELCRHTIDDLCRTTSTPSQSPEKKDDAKEKRKKAAKERQQRLMAQFTSKQKAVFEQFVQKESPLSPLDVDVERQPTTTPEKVFECVICNSAATLSVDQPIGLVAHTQATSVLAKSFSEDAEFRDLIKLDEENIFSVSRSASEKQFYVQLAYKFDQIFALAATNFGWEGGVYVQTCGHYVHCECQEMYMKAIRTDASQMQNSYLQTEKGEFYCPLCRQFSNCVLPLVPDIVDKSLVRSKNETNFDRSCEELMRLLEEPNESSITQTELEKRSNKFIVHLVHSTYPQFTRNVEDFEAIWAFLCSVLRTNMEIFSILTEENLLQKRSSCIGELLKLLANQVASLEPTELRHQLEWSRLTGVAVDLQTDVVANKDNEIPLLFQDPVAVLIRLTFLLTQNSSDSKHFSILFSAVFTLHLFQICLQEIKTLDDDTLSKFSSNGRTTAETVVETKTIRSLWTFVCQQFAFDKTNHDVYQPETSANAEFRQSYSLLDSIISKFGFDAGNGKKNSDSNAIRKKSSPESSKKFASESGIRKKMSLESNAIRKKSSPESSKKFASESGIRKKTSLESKRPEETKNSPGFDAVQFRKLFGSNVEKSTSQAKIEPIDVDEGEQNETNYFSSSAVDVDSIWTSIETKMLSLCLPFLRNIAILKQSAYSSSTLSFRTTDGDGWSDPLALINYITDKVGEKEIKLSFYTPNGANALKRWVDDVRLACKNDYKEIIETTYRSSLWKTPRLLRLPDNFDIIFRKYHQMSCQKCGRAPKEMLLCLTCARTICYRDSCCKSGNLTEIETHTIDCGAGTGVFLSVHSSLVIIVREKRFSHWGSLYLDAHGEEDRGLKRGKTLYLSGERLAVLEKQWLSHNFDGTCKRWNWLNQNPNTGNVIIL